MSFSRPSYLSEVSSFTLAAIGSIIFNIGGVFAGRTAVFFNGLRPVLPWVFLIYPLLLNVRGDLNGIFSSRLSTGLHLGTIKPSLIQNTMQYYQIISLILILSFYDSVIIGVITGVVGLILGIAVNVLSSVIITLTVFVFSTVISLFITSNLAFFVYRHNQDPDVFVYPISSTLNDLLITVIFVGTCYLYHPWRGTLYIELGIPFIVVCMITVIVLYFSFSDKDLLHEGFLQSAPILFLTTVISSVTGSVLSSFEHVLERIPILLTVYPAIISTVGAQNSIIANTSTTQLHTGLLEPHFRSLKSRQVTIPVTGIFFAGFVVSLVYALVGALLNIGHVSSLLFFLFVIVLILSNFLANTIILSITLSTAILTFKMNLDPDNLLLPLLSTFADLITTTILVALGAAMLL